MMKWLKKKLHNWFFHDDIDEQIELEEELESNIQPEKVSNHHRPNFRFPLISDDEQQLKEQYDTNSVLTPYHKTEQPSVNSQVYDVEVPRIHELLEQRRQNGYKKVPVKLNNKLYEKVTSRERKNETQHKFKETIKQETKVMPTRKRPFTPTDVPSPVYGFQKPKSIEELLSKKQKSLESSSPLKGENNNQQNDITVSEDISVGKQEVASRVIQEMNEKLARVKEEVQKVIAKPMDELSMLMEQSAPTVVEDAVHEEKMDNRVMDYSHEDYEEPKESVEEKIEEHSKETMDFSCESFVDIFENELLEEDVQQTGHLENQTFSNHVICDQDSKIESFAEQENDTGHEEHDLQNGRSMSETELEQEEEKEVEFTSTPVRNEEASSPKEKTIPFNVIMLKSDKEKLAAKFKNALHVERDQVPKAILEEEPVRNNQPLTDKKDQKDTQIFKEVEAVNEEMYEETSNYLKPPLEYLTPPEEATEDKEWMESQAEILVEALSHFQVNANVESIMQGPAVTQFEITVGHGTKVSKIRNLADDLKLALAAKDIRIQAPIPGKNTIGIEIPNRICRAVRLSEVVNSESFLNSDSPLEAALGLDLTGKPITIDLRKMPHGLIAGATGSGKSVCINSILVSLLLKSKPSELKLMLIDPKMVELAPFNHIPHLVSPVITDVKAATAALKWAVDEMERRYQLFAHVGVRDLPRYNKLVEKERKFSLKLPYILIVIDELADLMMMAPQDVEESICRIAQKARACGIHLIIATQRPSVDVITGLIKSNIPTRIAFAVSSQIDSRTILDSQGAERLLGRGDMLYLGNGMTGPIRLQGTYVTDDEIEVIVEHVKEQGEPDYFFEQEELLKKSEMVEDQDALFEEVCRFVFEQGTASTSLIQRKYHIGYNRAARLIEMLESYGFVSEQKGSKPRDVYITEADLEEMFGN